MFMRTQGLCNRKRNLALKIYISVRNYDPTLAEVDSKPLWVSFSYINFIDWVLIDHKFPFCTRSVDDGFVITGYVIGFALLCWEWGCKKIYLRHTLRYFQRWRRGLWSLILGWIELKGKDVEEKQSKAGMKIRGGSAKPHVSYTHFSNFLWFVGICLTERKW